MTNLSDATGSSLWFLNNVVLVEAVLLVTLVEVLCKLLKLVLQVGVVEFFETS